MERLAIHEQRQRVLCDHQLFIRRYDVNRNPAVGPRYFRGMAGIQRWVECNAEPGPLLGDAGTDAARIFADSSGEHEAVDALQGGGEHAGIEADAIDEIID